MKQCTADYCIIKCDKCYNNVSEFVNKLGDPGGRRFNKVYAVSVLLSVCDPLKNRSIEDGRTLLYTRSAWLRANQTKLGYDGKLAFGVSVWKLSLACLEKAIRLNSGSLCLVIRKATTHVLLRSVWRSFLYIWAAFVIFIYLFNTRVQDIPMARPWA